MAASLPRDFTSIYTAKAGGIGACSVMGLVVDILPPARSGGTSFVSTFTIKDCDFDSESWNGLKVKCFDDNESSILRPGVGDVVLLRNLKVRDMYGSVIGSIGQADKTVSWTVFRADPREPSGLVVTQTRQRNPPSNAEKTFALSLFNHDTFRPSSARPEPSPPAPRRQSNDRAVVQSAGTDSTTRPAGRSKKFSLLRDLQYGKFADIVGQVVKTFYQDSQRYILYVTDYTSHKDFFNYSLDEDADGNGRDGDEFSYISRGPKRKWPGPYGRMTIQITLWNPHSSWADEHVKEEDFVQLNNVQIKEGREALMEGALRTDRHNPDRLHISVIDDNDRDERVKEVVRRKIEYWKSMKGKIQRLEGGDKRQLSDGENQRSGKKSRTQRKKEMQKQRQRERQERQQKQKPDPDQPNLGQSFMKRDQLNSHVRASNSSVPCRSVRDVLDNESHKNSGPGGVEYTLPFQNLRYRLSVRVVDFFPPNLEDFAVSYNADAAMLADNNDNDNSNDNADQDDTDDSVTGRRRWEWRFCLLVEDAGPGQHYARDEKRTRMKVFVADADAVFLLCMDAEDLRANPQSLATLREKLFILWGDLEERKREKEKDGDAFNPDDSSVSVSTTPFTCCIKEYGVKTPPHTDPNEGKDECEHAANSLGWERRFRMFGTTINS